MTNKTKSETRIARLRYAGEEQFVGKTQSGHALVTGFASEGETAPSPMELILIALGGCAGADVVSILKKKRQRVTGYEIEVIAQRRQERPRIYTSIEVIHYVRGHHVDPKAVAHAVELSETKYCSVSAMLAAASKLSMRFEIINEDQ